MIEKEKTRFDFIQQDRRVIERDLRRHLMTAAEIQKILKSLPDEKDQADELVVYREKEGD